MGLVVRLFSIFLCCISITAIMLLILSEKSNEAQKLFWLLPNENFYVADTFHNVSSFLIVYSAYHDNIASSDEEFIRIIGFADITKLENASVNCYYYKEDFTKIAETVGSLVPSADGYNLQYALAFSFFLCPFRSRALNSEFNVTKPTYVKVVIDSATEEKLSGILKIKYPPAKEVYSVAACVQPLHSLINNPLQLLEWIEYNKLLGVEHITFYNTSIGLENEGVLKSYPASEIRVVPWKPPVPSRVWGQFIAASDCAHRYRGVAKYVLNFDVDEFLIVPSNFTSFPQLFKHIWETSEDEKRKINSITFKVKLCFNNWPKGGLCPENVRKYPEYRGVLEKLQLPHFTTLFPGTQAKFVFRPNRILESGVHFVTMPATGTQSFITDGMGFHIHFRDCVGYYQSPNPILINNATCNTTVGVERNTEVGERLGPLLVSKVMHKIESSYLLREAIKRYLYFNVL